MKNTGRPLLSVFIVIILMVIFLPGLGVAQDRQIFKDEDYARAEKFLRQYTNPLVFRASIRPNWVDEGLFWYRNIIPEGYEFMLVDGKKKSKKRAFDHVKLASVLSKVTEKEYEPFKLPFQSFEFSKDLESLIFSIDSRQYTYFIKENTARVSK